MIRRRLSAGHVCFIWTSVYSDGSLFTDSRRAWLSAHFYLWLNSEETLQPCDTNLDCLKIKTPDRANDCMDKMYWLYGIKKVCMSFSFTSLIKLTAITDQVKKKSACCQEREVTVSSLYLHKICSIHNVLSSPSVWDNAPLNNLLHLRFSDQVQKLIL